MNSCLIKQQAQLIANTASVHTVAPQDNSNPANNSVTINVGTR